MEREDITTLTIAQLLRQVDVTSPDNAEAAGQRSFAPIRALEPALQFSRERYGMRLVEQMIRLLRGHIARRNDEMVVETLKVQNASTDFSKVLKRARAGHYQLVGGFQKGSEPVMVISLEKLAEVIGQVMVEQSVVDLLPDRPPLAEPLPLAVGDRAVSPPVAL